MKYLNITNLGGKMKWNEAEVIINGVDVGIACAMTIRVAIEVFAATLGEDDDELTMSYRDRINDVRRAMGVIE